MTNSIQQFDYTADLLRAILWQYDNAPNLLAILQNEQAWYDVNHTQFWNDFYTDIFNLDTANDFGLQIWSIILGQPLFVNFLSDGRVTWGFGSEHENFERSNFASDASGSYRLPASTARVLLKLRYFQLTSAGTVPEINRALKWIFGEEYGVAWLNDNHDMTQMYTFTFPLPSDLIFIFNNFDVLPRPAGVGSEYRVIVNDAWGFDEFHENFDNGNFSEL